MHTLLVGVGQEIITPPLGTMMMGYSPMRPALSVHDDLHVTAFAFQSGDTQVLLLSADLCNIAFPQAEIRAAITEAFDLLKAARENKPMSRLPELFTEYKRAEIVNI